MPAPPFWFSGPLGILGEERRAALRGRGRRLLAEARVQVTPILYDVRDNGDAALLRLAKKFDGADLELLTVEDWLWKKQVAALPDADRKAIDALAGHLRKLHGAARPAEREGQAEGLSVGWRALPLDRVGIYVPGGPGARVAALMACAIPAKAAGVKEVVACTPAKPDGSLDPRLMAAADAAGVDEVYKVGGAQAVFAMALGTKTVPACAKVVGRGNVYVQAAKQLVAGQVATDALAGPGEVLVLADDSADPRVVAWELLAHAEHDPQAASVLVTTSERLHRRAEQELAALAQQLGGAAAQVLGERAALLTVGTMAQALALANELAPERAVVLTEDPEALLPKLPRAGAVHLGPHAPAGLADLGLLGGALPTYGNARHGGPLTPADFVRAQAWAGGGAAALAKLSPMLERIAAIEGAGAIAGALAERGAKGGAAKRPAKDR